MAVNWMFFRVHHDSYLVSPQQSLFELTEETALPFGSLSEVTQKICSYPGFDTTDDWREQVVFSYKKPDGNERRVVFGLDNDPVICISTRRNHPEDFLVMAKIFTELAPFMLIGGGDPIDPQRFSCSLDEWLNRVDIF